MKKLSQDSNTIVMLIWFIKQVKDFILKFLTNGSFCWSTRNYIRFFFPFRWRSLWCVGEVSLIKQMIKDVNFMWIAFSVKHPKIFWESWMSLSNMSRTISNIYTYPFNPQLVIKTYVENHDKKPKDQRNFYMWTIIF